VRLSTSSTLKGVPPPLLLLHATTSATAVAALAKPMT
jgi:hypothetical protein